ncbi:E2 ubiquitin-conjugating protein [Pichia kluyveri]|uniref:Ubiquitin-conjugating enzyme E2 1 n=1 Tax=Pichia kluyveri TaxID=36015 RepID=A0AAV5QZ12_PICKL|nr:E2 ubiquitin-conjugating protein [Pichia kluyveri]
MSRAKRIAKELEDVKKDQLSGVTLEMAEDDDLSHLKGTFLGPPGTPYEGGLFEVDIKIPNEYPFKPPIMKFDTRIYHPNISSQTGAICLDILKDAWTPILTLKSSLISLQSLLQSPEPTDPQDAQVAKIYLSDPKKFAETAANWTKIYAPNENYKPTGKEDYSDFTKLAENQKIINQDIDDCEKYGIDKNTVKIFEDMGFPRDKIIDALRKLNLKHVRIDDDMTQQKVLDEILS